MEKNKMKMKMKKIIMNKNNVIKEDDKKIENKNNRIKNNVIKKINSIKLEEIKYEEILTENTDKNKRHRQSLRNILPTIMELDEKVRMLIEKNNKNLYYPTFRFYLKEGDNLQKYIDKKKCIVTSIFLNETYIPDILVMGQSFRNGKTKLPLICMVQDTPHKEHNGISKEGIEDILKIFDVVIGVDLIQIHNFRDVRENNFFYSIKTYTNMLYYVTKYYIFALTQFKQIYYFDASVYVGPNVKNIDSLLNRYKGNVFTYRPYRNILMGLNGSFMVIEPNIKYFYKFLYICDNYMKIFKENIFYFNPDETICYFSIFPEWDGRVMDYNFFCQKVREKINHRQDCLIRRFQIIKPFRPFPPDFNVSKLKSSVFDEWDNIVNQILNKHKSFEKYYSHIHEFRQTKIKIKSNNKIEDTTK